MIMDNWSIDHNTTNGLSVHLESILDFLLSIFCNIFGNNVMHGENCIVFNDPNTSCPKFIHSHPARTIRLHVSSLNLWDQVIYQLGHEMCHYALHQHKGGDNYTLKWFEEIVCEAISLYILKYSKDNWKKCRLSRLNVKYWISIAQYLVKQKNGNGNAVLENIHTLDDLRRFNSQCENIREDHHFECNSLYESIKLNPSKIRFLVDYPQYLMPPERLLLDFEKWEKNDTGLHDNAVFILLQNIQPKISR